MESMLSHFRSFDSNKDGISLEEYRVVLKMEEE